MSNSKRTTKFEIGITRDSLRRKRKNVEDLAEERVAADLFTTDKRRPGRPAKAEIDKSAVPAKRSRKQACDSVVAVKRPESTLNINSLPTEVLGKIVGFLSLDDLFRVERVNRRFRAIAQGYVWPQKDTLDHDTIILNSGYPKISHEDVRFGNRTYLRRHRITEKSIKMVFSRAKIRKLDLAIYNSTLTYQVASAFALAPQLNDLNLSFIRLTNNSLRTIARYCPLLEKVSLESCFCDGRVENGLDSLFTKCPNIKYLDLSENNKLYGDSFASVPEGLLYLNLANCYNVDASHIDALTQKAQNLETLILENCDNLGLTNFNIWLGNLKKLRFLEVSSIFMTDGFPPMDFSKFEQMEMLCVRYNSLVNSRSLETLHNCKKLRILDLKLASHFDEATLKALKKCKSLQYCNFSNYHVKADMVDFIKSVKLLGVALNECNGIKEELVIRMLKECPHLDHIELTGLNLNFEKIVPALFASEAQRPKLTLVVSTKDLNIVSLVPSWVNVIICDNHTPTPFAAICDIRAQYHPK